MLVRTLLIALLAVSTFAWPQTQKGSNTSAGQQDWSAVEQTLGRAGKLQGDVYKVTFPRTDLTVTIGQTKVEPGAGLTSWAAFRPVQGGVVADGDLAVLESELNPVTSAFEQHGIEVTALHNHLASERPAVMFVHFFVQKDLRSVLDGLKAVLAATRTPTGPAKASEAALPYDRKAIEAVLGQGTANGVVLSFAFPRHEQISMHGITLPPAMGMATSINFQPAPGGVAATGDFVLREAEVTPVVSQLQKGNIAVTAIHNHMLDDSPHMIFVHFWGEGRPEQVARSLKSAVDVVR